MDIRESPTRHHSPSEVEDALRYVWLIMAQGFRQAHQDTSVDEIIQAVRDEAEKVEQSLECLADFVSKRTVHLVDGAECWVVNPREKK